MISKRFAIIGAAALLILFSVLSLSSATRESLTYDEIVHVQEGKNAWEKHQFQIDTNNPPFIREVTVIPLLIGGSHMFHSPLPNIQMLPARIVTIGMGVLLGALIFYSSSVFFGPDVALLALFLYVFEPNILGNSHYVTLDIGAALFFFLAYMSLFTMLKNPTRTNFIIHGSFVGLMAASKITTVPYYFISAVWVYFSIIRKQYDHWIWQRKVSIALSVAVCLLAVWSTYFFRTDVIVAPGNAMGRVSTALSQLAGREHNGFLAYSLDFLRHTPVPLGNYIAVLKNSAVRTTRPTPYFFLGKFYSTPKWYFMIVNVIYKTPLALLILFLAGVFSFLMGKISTDRAQWLFIIPVLSILIVSFFARMQPLIRYVLPMYPFIIIIAATVIVRVKHVAIRLLLFLLCVWYVVGSLSFHPYYLSYMNELAGPEPTNSLRFVDSNIDWGQSLESLVTYVRNVRPSALYFSYFGRDDAAPYGLPSILRYGGYKFEDICAFHKIDFSGNTVGELTAISLSNWYYCGYYLKPQYQKSNIIDVVGHVILLFHGH